MVIAVSKAIEAGRDLDHLRVDREHVSASAAAYGAAAGIEVAVVLPKGAIAVGKLLQALIAGVEGRRGRRQLRRCAADRSIDDGRGRLARDARELGEPAPDRRSEDGGVRDLRRPRAGAGRRSRSPSGTPATSPPTGPGSPTTRWRESWRRGPGCTASRPPARRRSCEASRSRSPRRSRRRSRSAIRRRGRARSRPATNLAGASTRSPTTRSSRPTARLAELEGVFCEPSSAASVAGVAKAAAGGAILASELVVAVLTGNGLKDPETAEKVVAGRIVESDATEARRHARRSGGERGGERRVVADRSGGRCRGAGDDREPRRRATTASGWRSTCRCASRSRRRRRATIRHRST